MSISYLQTVNASVSTVAFPISYEIPENARIEIIITRSENGRRDIKWVGSGKVRFGIIENAKYCFAAVTCTNTNPPLAEEVEDVGLGIVNLPATLVIDATVQPEERVDVLIYP